jgi:hypothetical protein
MKRHPALSVSGLSHRAALGRVTAVGAAIGLGSRVGRVAAQDAIPFPMAGPPLVGTRVMDRPPDDSAEIPTSDVLTADVGLILCPFDPLRSPRTGDRPTRAYAGVVPPAPGRAGTMRWIDTGQRRAVGFVVRPRRAIVAPLPIADQAAPARPDVDPGTPPQRAPVGQLGGEPDEAGRAARSVNVRKFIEREKFDRFDRRLCALEGGVDVPLVEEKAIAGPDSRFLRRRFARRAVASARGGKGAVRAGLTTRRPSAVLPPAAPGPA